MGNLASGCGAVDMMISLIGVNRGKIPPALNCDELDPEMELDMVVGSPRPTDNPTFRDDESDSDRPGSGPRYSRVSERNLARNLARALASPGRAG